MSSFYKFHRISGFPKVSKINFRMSKYIPI